MLIGPYSENLGSYLAAHQLPSKAYRDTDGIFWLDDWDQATDGEPPTVAAVSNWLLTDAEKLFQRVQAKLDGDEFLRTGKAVDPKGAVSVARAWAATAMLYEGWHYPSIEDLEAGVNPQILAAIYAADPTITAESTTDEKREQLHFALVMGEGQAFGIDYVAELGAYERTASKAILEALASDSRDWLDLPCGPWSTVRGMFLAVLR